MIQTTFTITLFLSRSLLPLSSFLLSLAGFATLSEYEESPAFSPFFFSTARSFSLFISSSCFLHEFSPSCRSLLFRRSSSCRLMRSFSFCRRSFSRSLSWSASRSLNSFRPYSSVLCKSTNLVHVFCLKHTMTLKKWLVLLTSFLDRPYCQCLDAFYDQHSPWICPLYLAFLVS